MKRLIGLLLLLAGVQASAQTCATWCAGAPLVSASSVVIGSSITVTASFTSATADTGAILATVVYDPAGTQVAKGWQAVTFAAGQTITAIPVVYSPVAGALIGTYTVALGIYEASGTQDLWQNAVASLTVVAPASNGPACLPKVQWPLAVVWGSIPAGVSTRYDTYAVWICNLPGGYFTTSTMFAASNLLPLAMQYAGGTWTAAQAAADCAATCASSTPAELAFITPIMQANRPKALVTPNGASTTQPVYTIFSDGTLNPVPIANETIAVGTTCDETARIVTAPSYFSVAGQKDQAGSAFTTNIYALCTVSPLIGTN